jgi:ribonuclease P/MRP protein subunit POP1
VRLLVSLLTQFSALTGGFRFSFEDGARMAETTFYRQGQWPQGFLTPAQVMWRPLPASSGSESSELEPIRQLWIRFHPSTHASVFSTLRGAIPHALSQPAFQCQDVKVELNDVRESVCVFELTGPKSGKVLKGALGELVRDEPREEIKTVRPRPATRTPTARRSTDPLLFFKIWKELPDIASPGSVPRGMVLGLRTYDPRLQCVFMPMFSITERSLIYASSLSFPPQNIKPSAGTRRLGTPIFSHHPSATLAESELWNPHERSSLAKRKFKKVELDQRRAKVGFVVLVRQSR